MSEEYRDWQDETVKVVKNLDGICSIWPAEKQNPEGWQDVGVVGTKQECLAHIEEHCDSNCHC